MIPPAAHAPTAEPPRPRAANPWLSHTAVIGEITPEAPGVATYTLHWRDPLLAETYTFRPGQFNMLYLPGVGEAAISLSADPQSRDGWAHTIRVAGNVTQALSRLPRGATLGLRGPFGRPWPMQECAGKNVILIAGGIGLPPLRPAIYEFLAQRDQYRQMTLLHGARTAEMLLYGREYADWKAGGLDVQTTVDQPSPGWQGNVGVVPLLLDRVQMQDPQNTLVLMCGPEVMLRYCALAALHRGIPRANVWISTERNIQCAVGLCGHCQLGPDFICKDGPVFRYDHIAPYLDVDGL